MEVTPEAVKEVYRRVKKGESIRSVAEELGLDRKTLRKRMPEYLTEEEMKEFLTFSKPGRKPTLDKAKKMPRGKKNEDVDLTEEIKKLGQSGITPEQIELVLNRMKEHRSTTLTRETFIYKMLEMLEYIKKRNQSIKPGTEGYISSDDLVSMIERNPRIMTIDVNYINEVLTLFDKEAMHSTIATNELIKTNPLIFNNSCGKLGRGITILKKFDIELSLREKENLLDYCMQEGGKIFQVNTQKLFHRLCYYSSKNGRKAIGLAQYRTLNRKEFKQGLNNMTDEKLEKMYQLPDDYDDFEGKVQKIIDNTVGNNIPI